MRGGFGMAYGVRCYRYSSSAFGSAEAWLKREGTNEAQTYATLAEAQEEAKRLNEKRSSMNVGYEAMPMW